MHSRMKEDSRCFFDLLPIELLEKIFTYFSCHEILHSFSHLSQRTEVLLSNYSGYRVDLQSISIGNYHLICRQILPEQIIYLKLSDDERTPGLSEHFFSQFSIDQFTQLRSLHLSEIEITSFQFIFPHLHKLSPLVSLSFQYRSTRYSFRQNVTLCAEEIDRITSQTRANCSRIIPRLSRLHCDNLTGMINRPCPHLLDLKLNKCSAADLQQILLQSSHLRSLDVVFDSEKLPCHFLLTSKQLIRLRVTILRK